MNCPVCQAIALCPVELETGLYFRECPQCHGHWLPSFNYHNWRAMHGPSLPLRQPEAASEDETLQASATGPAPAGPCPECGSDLQPYPVGHGVCFELDHCDVCGGTWFDANEWAVLRRRNLHDDIHSMFMAAWQSTLTARDPAAVEADAARLFSPDDYRRLRRFRAWMDAHARRPAMLAYLRHERPH